MCKVSKHILKEVASLCYFNPGKKHEPILTCAYFAKGGGSITTQQI